MRKYLLLMIILFLINIVPVNALINITEVDKVYAIGDKISPRVKIISDMDIQALFSAKLVCEEYELTYFVEPLNLEQDKKIIVDVPPLETFDRMLGTCVIDFYLNSLIGAEIEKRWTDGFKVTREKKFVEEEISISNVSDIEIIEEDIEKENKGGGLIYLFLFIMIIIIISYLYLKFKFKNKNKFNKGWRLHK